MRLHDVYRNSSSHPTSSDTRIYEDSIEMIEKMVSLLYPSGKYLAPFAMDLSLHEVDKTNNSIIAVIYVL